MPGAVAQLSASGKFTSNQRIDDGNLRIVGPSSRRNSSIPEPRTTYPHHSPGSPIQLSPVDKYKTSRRRNTNKRPSTTSAGNMRHRKSATSSLQIRPSTRARAEWRMEIDDPLHVNKRLKTGAVHFETHLSTVESVTLFDSNGGETKKLTDMLLHTGGHRSAGHGGLTHHQQAQKVLQRARHWVTQHNITATQHAHAQSSTSNPPPVNYSEKNQRQAASIHHAVLRLMSQSCCCSYHSALLTDAAFFFRTSFIDSIVAVKKERGILRQRAELEINKAKEKVNNIKDRATGHRSIMRKVLQRNAFRTLKQLKQVVFRTWRMDTVATITAKIRKQRSRGLICRALVRLGVRRRTNEIFVTWRKIANSSKQQRVLAENQNAFKQESKQKKDEMKQTMQLFEQERTQYKEEINELKGLLEVLTRAMTSTSDKLETAMKNGATQEKEEKEEKEATPLTPRSVLKQESSLLALHLNQIMKKLIDSGDYTINSSHVTKAIVVNDTTQTTVSSFVATNEQEVQTEINSETMTELESTLKQAQLDKVAAAKAAMSNVTESTNEPPPKKEVETADSCSQTRLTMKTISSTLDKVATLQNKCDALVKKYENIAAIAEVTPPPIIVPKIIQLPDTLLKEKQLSMFLKKVHLDAAQDFTNKDIKELVLLLDIHEVSPGDDIIQQGEEATWFGMLLSGELDVVVNGVGTVATMKSGALLGELSFLGGSLERTANVTTRTNGVVAAIPFRRIVELQHTNDNLFRKFMLLVAEAGIVKLFSADSRLKKQIETLKKELEDRPTAVEKKEGQDEGGGDRKEEQEEQEEQEDRKEEQEEQEDKVFDTSREVFEQPSVSMSDSESEYGSEHGSDLSSLEHNSGHQGSHHAIHHAKKKRHKRKRRSSTGFHKKNKGHKFLKSSHTELFYRTKVAQANGKVEEMLHKLEKEEREMNHLRAKVKGEAMHIKNMEKEMEFMQMKLAAAGLD